MEAYFGFISVIVVGSGIYGLYAYVQMRRTGHINETLLLGKGITAQMCKDKEAYTKKAAPALLVFGIVGILSGAIDMYYLFVDQSIRVLQIVGIIAFGVMLVWYMVYTVKLREKYF